MLSVRNSGTEISEVKSVPLLDVRRGNGSLKEEILHAVSEIIDSGRFIGGPHCESLERSVAEISGTEFAVGCASGSDALLLALMAIDVGPGDEVICPSFTFFATASAISRLGATPIFVDIDPVTFNMDAALIESKINRRTKAILPVHLFGQCCDMDAILDVARKNNLQVIEDAAQSIGATYQGKPAGSMGDIGCFSFYPTKNLGGFGDGGMLTTGNPALADKLRLLANHGMRPRYYHQQIGINSRLDSIQAAVLGIKIRKLREWIVRRGEIASRYQQLLTRSGLSEELALPQEPDCGDSLHVWNQYTIRIPDGWRDQVRQKLANLNVGTEIYYPVPVHRQECFSDLQFVERTLPETEKAASEVLSLPVFPELTVEEQRYTVSCLGKVMHAHSLLARVA